MALEAGSAAHEGFAAVRWYQYRYYQCKTQVQFQNAEYHGKRLFPNGRYERMTYVLKDTATHRTNCINFAIEAIESSDFYDDISDTRRTISNINEAMISYIDAYDMIRYPIWIRDVNDPKTDIGIEIPFDIVVTVGYNGTQTLEVRFTGKLDGLHVDPKKDNRLIIEENKSGARLDDAWLAQWVLSHQITGYCVASGTFTGIDCKNATISGMRIPIGKNASEGIRKETVNRSDMLFNKWAEWFVTSVLMEQEYRDNVGNAPMYTHSCNRYFSSCTFLPFCASDSDQEKQEIITEMEDDEWNVLEE